MSARLRGDLSAAFAQVIAAIVDGCLDGAERGEAISEVMRLHQRVLRTLRPVLITSP
jgi:urease gamma subunit